jgi:hypothetical protein
VATRVAAELFHRATGEERTRRADTQHFGAVAVEPGLGAARVADELVEQDAGVDGLDGDSLIDRGQMRVLAEAAEHERDASGLIERGRRVDPLGRHRDRVGIEMRANEFVGVGDGGCDVRILAGRSAGDAERDDQIGGRVQVDRALLLRLQIEQRRAQHRARRQGHPRALLGGAAAGGRDQHRPEVLARQTLVVTGGIGGGAADLAADDATVPAIDRDRGAFDGLGQVDLAADGPGADVTVVRAGDGGEGDREERDAGQRRGSRLRHGGLGARDHGVRSR